MKKVLFALVVGTVFGVAVGCNNSDTKGSGTTKAGLATTLTPGPPIAPVDATKNK